MYSLMGIQLDGSLTLGLFFQGIGPWELVIVLVIALLIFGKRLPQVARNMGQGIVEFKRGLRGVENDIEREVNRPVDAKTDSGNIESKSEQS